MIGGTTWQPGAGKITPTTVFRHVYDYLVGPDTRYVVGEMGLVWIQDQPRTRFRQSKPELRG